jgi:HlyD family secretion protein
MARLQSLSLAAGVVAVAAGVAAWQGLLMPKVTGALNVAGNVTAADTSKAPAPAPVTAAGDWVAAGPGRVEPITGEIRVGSPVAGQIGSILVFPRDKVFKGALLAIIEDSEQQARVKAAEAEVAFRESERDVALSAGVANERRSAEDNLAKAEKDMRRDQAALDQLAATHAQAQAIDTAQTALAASRTKFLEMRRALEVVLSSPNAPRPTRTESAVVVARAELGVAHAALDKTRVRAPRDGVILQSLKTEGDMASATLEDVLFTMGDISRLRVRVEVDENDIGNIAAGQGVIVRSDAFTHWDISGVVAHIGVNARARVLGAQRAIVTPKDNAIDVIVELDTSTPLVPGMRVDAFFKPTHVATDK